MSSRVRTSSTTYLQSDRTQENQANSPLLRLLPELRNIIYEYVLRMNYPIEMIRTAMRDRAGPKRHLLALLGSCSQINTETAMLPYTLNVFAMTGWIACSNTWKLLHHTGQKQLQAIKRMQLRTAVGSIVMGLEGELASLKGLEMIEVRDSRGQWNEDLIRRIKMRMPGIVISKIEAFP